MAGQSAIIFKKINFHITEQVIWSQDSRADQDHKRTQSPFWKKKTPGKQWKKIRIYRKKSSNTCGLSVQTLFCASIDWEQYWDAKLSLSLNKFLIPATMWTNANLKATNKKNKSAHDCYARGKGLITIWRKGNHGAAFARHAFMWFN